MTPRHTDKAPSVVTNGETGVLVAPGDAGKLRDALLVVRAQPERAGRIASAGRALALREYSSDSMVDRYLALYAQLLHR